MGLRYRGRTKGKNGWLNFSYSEKNGIGVSASVKAGPFTWNSGNGKTTKKRITTNLPGGFYHVTSEKGQSRPKSAPQHTTPSEPWTDEDTKTAKRWGIYAALVLAGAVVFGGAGVILVALVIWIYNLVGSRYE